jgi:dynein heavy chain 1
MSVECVSLTIRFGNALLVEDIESIDPILNSVLNHEVSKVGGRVMITLGDKQIDFSPSFTIFLSTRDPGSKFTPDLCSRVTFVNFTVTPDSLTSQCLARIMKVECPDMDRKRSEMLRAQGEYRLQLRQNEDDLLATLAKVRGNILDDDTVLSSLESLKSKASAISQAMQAAEEDLEKVLEVSNQYRPLALACSAIYFTLERLASIHYIYQFSLPFFLSIVETALDMVCENEETDTLKRCQFLASELFRQSYCRVSRSILNTDRLSFALRLAQIYITTCAPLRGGVEAASELDDDLLAFLMRGEGMLNVTSADMAKVDVGALAAAGLSAIQLEQLKRLCCLPSFRALPSHFTAHSHIWKCFLQPLESTEPSSFRDDNTSPQDALSERSQRTQSSIGLPAGWTPKDKKYSVAAQAFLDLVLIKVGCLN